MPKLTRNLLITYWGSVLLLASNPASAGLFTYDVNSFEINNGTNVFFDDFNDGIEPPSGPASIADYASNTTISSDAEAGGRLELRQTDAQTDQNGDDFVGLFVQNSNFFLTAGNNASVVASFEINDGWEDNTFFGIGLFSLGLDGPSDDDQAFARIFRDDLGNFTASWDDENNEFSQDITAQLAGVDKITIALTVSASNQVSVSYDWNSDGSLDLVQNDFSTLAYTTGVDYSSGLLAGADATVPSPAPLALLGLGLFGIQRLRRKA